MAQAIRLPAIALSVLVAICALPGRELAKDQPDVVRPAAGRWERVHKLIQGHVDKREIAGAVVLVQQGGKPVYHEAIGQADAEANKPMTRDTIFRIASMTKPITSVAVMVLVEEGKLRLEDALAKHLPEFTDMTVLVPTKESYRLVKADQPITIRQLLTHTSGIIYRFSGRPHLAKLFADAGVSDGLAETEGTISENVKRIAKLPLLHQPGKTWEYGLSTDVLGRVIEVVSGKTLDEFFRQRIFTPLQMNDTGFLVPKEKRSRLAALYTPDDKKAIRRVGNEPVHVGSLVYSATYPTADSSRYYSGGAGLVSTARDYGRFLQMLLNRGELDGKRLLKPETVEQMTRNQIGDQQIAFTVHGDGFGYGFGVVTGREKPPSPASVGSYSWGGIFNTFFWVDPRRQLIGVLLTQLYPFDHLTLWKDFQSKVYEVLGEEPRGKKPASARCCASTRMVRSPTTILSSPGRTEKTVRPGLSACGTRSRLPCSWKRAGFTSTMLAAMRRKSTKASPARITVGRRNIAANTFSPTSIMAGSGLSTLPSQRWPGPSRWDCEGRSICALLRMAVSTYCCAMPG
jgi:CubicO group peptidase (beta-lactamase class C family)